MKNTKNTTDIILCRLTEAEYCVVAVHIQRNFFLSSSDRSSWNTLQNMRTAGWSAEKPFLYSVFCKKQKVPHTVFWELISSMNVNSRQN